MGSQTSQVHVRNSFLIYPWIGTGRMQAFMFSNANSDVFSERHSCLNMLVRDCGDQHTHVPKVTFACALIRT